MTSQVSQLSIAVFLGVIRWGSGQMIRARDQPARVVKRPSTSDAEGAPSTSSREPSAPWNTHAGWPDTPNEAKIEPSGSRTLVKVRPWRDTKSSISSSLPFQPTPTTVTFPAHFLLAASTEGASLLQVPQYGAQNQNATGEPL